MQVRKLVTIVVLATLPVVLFGCTGGPFRATNTLVQELGLAGANVIDLSTPNGQVQIAPYAGETLQATVVRAAGAADTASAEALLRQVEVTIKRQSNVAAVKVSFPAITFGSAAKADLTVLVPENWHGTTKVYTGNGSITATAGNLVDTGFGDFESGNGRITINNWNGGITANSGNGRINVQHSILSTNSCVRTGNGSISLELVSQPARVESSTGNGDITLSLPRTTRATVNAIIGNGRWRITGSFGNYELKHTGTYDLNGGGIPLVLSTGNGSITISGI